MKTWIIALAALAIAATGQAAAAQEVPAAIFTDPVRDAAHPARMEVLHIPSGGVAINGLAYVAAGAGPHPVVLLCHGLPGHEKNLDLAQAIRRAGWTVVTFNYRGSWGSPGSYRFANDLEDADAVLAWLRTPANAARLGIDPKRIAMVGHSLGGWVTALTAAHDPALIGAAMISPGNIGFLGRMPRDTAAGFFAANGLEALADTSGTIMADEAIAHADAFDFVKAGPRLTGTNLFVLTSDDGFAPEADRLAAAVKAAGGKKLSTVHVATDHGWSDRRIRLESEIIRWLDGLGR
ncbi:alpha/beta fold hydrolase [Sphingomonas sp. QA11]|uniref:alpha/beta hydrolase family protein n=1 Tax=Sphingomonas sp. QA11 TaxID=2950605 RepID=UPI002349E20A|nr:alpha/beta fold hydrolase [Sphingomonas sp. QA11]WCM25244.1 alpha/beta fold hydrolase [Sphingomonas sp. QA11]